MKPNIETFFEPTTWTVSYVIFYEVGGSCAIIDPVLDYDAKSGRTSTQFADKQIEFIKNQQLTVEWILETHAHADHLSLAHYLRSQLGGKIAIGNGIPAGQETFKKMFNLGDEFTPNGSHFDHLLADGEIFQVGKLSAKAISAETRLFMCHGYPPTDRAIQWQSTVADQRAHNIHVHDGINEDEFVAMRTARDATLDMPNFLLPSIQTNIRVGELPPRKKMVWPTSKSPLI